MRNLTTTLFTLSLLFVTPVFAGAGHDHGHSHDPVSKTQAEEIATKSVSKLVEKGKIDDTWTSVSVSTAEKKKFGEKMEWVVTFKNEKVSDPAKQTLYIFLSLGGDYIAANYTGN